MRAFKRYYHLLVSCARPPLDADRAVSVAIVGSGPAGMYTADELLRCSSPPASIHIFERAPLPFGLLRYGVAPDHPEVRLVEHKFHDEVLDERSVSLFGCVEVGRDVSLAQLCDSYDAVFLCHGTSRSKHLPLPVKMGGSSGPALPIAQFGDQGYMSSQQVVGWYNGELGMSATVKLDLTNVKHVVIVGAGNVALDIGRLLVKPPSLLEETTLVRTALDQLRTSAVQHVTIVARRGAVHAAFSTKELRELCQVPDVDVTVDAEELKKAVQEAENMDRPVKRLVKLLQDVASRPLRGSKRLHFAFGASPEALLRDASGAMSGLQTSIGTIPADLVVSSVGYVADTPDPALAPLASSGSFLQNSRGRIRKGLYVTGWAKRGSSGIVGTNKFCAAETVQSFLLDSLVPTKCGMPPPLPSTALSREQMEKIEIKEKEKGGRFTRLEDMIKALD